MKCFLFFFPSTALNFMERLDLSLVFLFRGVGALDGIHAGNRLSRFFPIALHEMLISRWD